MALPTTTRQPMHETMSYDPNVQKQIADINKVKPKTPQQECKERGGVWDEKTQTCVMIKPQEAKQTPEDIVKQQVQEKGGYIGADGQFVPPTTQGKIVNFNEDGTVDYTTPQGVHYKLTREEYKNLLDNQAGRRGAEFTQDVAEIQAIEQGGLDLAQRELELRNLGLNDAQIMAVQTGLVESPIDWGQAITSGVMGALPTALGAAAGGLATGAMIGAAGGPIGAAGGALIGGVGGLITGLFNGIQGNIKGQKTGNISASAKTLASARTNMRQLVTLASKDPNNAAVYIDTYNQQLAKVYEAQRQVKLDTSGNLNSYMDDGTVKLADFERFLSKGGEADIYTQRLQNAIMTGQAPALTLEDFEDFDMGDLQ